MKVSFLSNGSADDVKISLSCMEQFSCVKFTSFLLDHLCLDKCHRVHFHLPYRWEVFDSITWTEL